MTVDEKVLSFFRKKAEQLVEREYNDKIYEIKKDIGKRQNKRIDDETKRLRKEWQYENQTLIGEFKNSLESAIKNHSDEFDRSMRLFDQETSNGFLKKSDAELLSAISISTYERKSEYDRACRDIIRNHKTQLRTWTQTRRKEKQQVLSQYKAEEEKIKIQLKKQNQDEYERVFRSIEIQRQDILKKTIDQITNNFTQKQRTEIELFNEDWNRIREDKIYTIIEDTIKRDKDKIIGHTGRELSTEVFDIHEVFTERVQNQWNVERAKRIKTKLQHIPTLVDAAKFKIKKKYETLMETKIQEFNSNLKKKLKIIDNEHTIYIEQIITQYKDSIIKELQDHQIKIDKYANSAELAKLKRDAERSHRTRIRNEQKKLRSIGTNSINNLPSHLISQIETHRIQSENKKNKETDENEKRIFEMKNLYEECKQKEFNEQKTRIELDEKAKVIAAVDATESEWKNSKKEESLLLNKVKYNAHLETKLLENNQLLKQQDEMISGLKQQVHIHKTKITDLKDIIRKQALELENLKEEREFLKKFKEKYLEVQAAKKKKKKPTRGVWSRHTIIEEPKTLEDFQEIEKKLLMKSVLREKGPIFAHVYKCNGIYRDESDLEICFKASGKNVITIKYEHQFNTFSIECFESKISLPFAFEVNKFFCIRLKIVNKLLSVQIGDGNLGSYDVPDDGLLNELVIRLKSNKSVFYHHFIRPME